MKRKIVWAAIFAALLIFSAMLLPATAAQQPLVTSTATPTRLPTYSVVLASDIYVRGGPGLAYMPVGRLGSGDILEPLSRSADNEWVLIAYNRGFGWIRRDLAYWSINVDALPQFDETDLTPTPVPGTLEPTAFVPTDTPEGNWVRAGERGAYLRAGPGIQYPILDSLRGGEIVVPVGRDAATGWILIQREDDSFAWISRPLVFWTDDLASLPVLVDDALTPSATLTHTATFTRTLRPTRTFTPTRTATSTNTATVTDTATNTFTPSFTPTNTRTHTFTPSATNTLTITPSATFTATETFTSTQTSEPSATPFTASATPEPTTAATETPTQPPSLTSAIALVATRATSTPSATNTRTQTPTLTATDSPTQTNTVTSSPTASDTLEPPAQTSTLTNTATNTLRPVTRTLPPPSATSEAAVTASAELSEMPTASSSPTPTRTIQASATQIPPTEADTFTPTETFTPGFDAGATATRMLLETAVANSQRTADAAATLALETPVASEMALSTHTATIEPTNTSVQATAASMTTPTIEPAATETPDAQIAPEQNETGLRPEFIVAGLLLLAALIYVALYLRGASRANTYASGFVVERCPVCARGTLYAETRQERILGIPRIQFTVRCTECRSILREVGNDEWRYAVDPAENPELFERWNNRIVTSDQLKGMAAGRRAGLGSRSHVRPRKTPPDNPGAN